MDKNLKSLKKLLKEYRDIYLISQSLDTDQKLPAAFAEIQNIIYASDILRRTPVHGELYYKILYYNYMSPEIYYNVYELIDILKSENIYLSQRTYYRRKNEALVLLLKIIDSTKNPSAG